MKKRAKSAELLTVRLHLVITRSQSRRLKRTAQVAGRSIGHVTRKAIDAYLMPLPLAPYYPPVDNEEGLREIALGGQTFESFVAARRGESQ